MDVDVYPSGVVSPLVAETMVFLHPRIPGLISMVSLERLGWQADFSVATDQANATRTERDSLRQQRYRLCKSD